jgi:hypothetical protein
MAVALERIRFTIKPQLGCSLKTEAEEQAEATLLAALALTTKAQLGMSIASRIPQTESIPAF